MYLAPGTDRSRESPRDVSLTNHAQTGKLTVPQDTCCEIHHATTDGRRSESICRFAEFCCDKHTPPHPPTPQKVAPRSDNPDRSATGAPPSAPAVLAKPSLQRKH